MAEHHDLASEKWKSSGLTDQHAKLLKLTALSADQTAALGFLRVPALRIPYFDTAGKPTSFYRVRYLGKLPGFAGAVEKPQRYVQPKGTLNEVYLPPLMGSTTWATVLADPARALVITEGEFKAAAACAAGLPCVGLGGVDVWRSGKRGLELLPTLESTQWTGRKVYVVYDSDAATNPNVVRAQNQLVKALQARGAFPMIAALPAGKDGKKQGLDDYLVAHGVEELRAVLDDAAPLGETQALWDFNTQVAYIRDPGMVVEMGNGQLLSPQAFIAHAYANRHVTIETANGPKRKPLAKHWMEWEQRLELERVTYAPGQPRITDAREWNQWEGWGCAPRPGDVKPWKRLLDYVFQGQPKERQWFERWCAYPLQHPGAKLFTSVVVWSVHHGTGKTLMGYTLRDIYGKNATEIKDADLRSGFNEWAKSRQFVIGDEVTGSDKRAEADRIKGLITQEQLRVNAKFMPSYVVPDCVNYYFTSNHPDAFFLEDHDRRFFVHEIPDEPMPQAFYDEYDEWLKRRGGAAFLFDYLLKLDLGDFHPRAPAPFTSAKQDMIADGKSDLGSWVMRLKEDPEGALLALGAAAAKGCDLFTPSQLHTCYDPEHATKVTVGGIGRELRRGGIRKANGGGLIRVHAGPVRLYAVRNGKDWARADPKKCAEHYDAFFGPKTKKF